MPDFWQTIFGDEKGYVHVALYKNGKPVSRKFIKWPEERRKLNNIAKSKAQGDLYYSPALYSSESATRAACLGSRVTWADVDADLAEQPTAGLLVASGSPGHVHAYWPAGRLLEPSEAEAWNYYNVLAYGADKGGWDITQLLRAPDTWNHKTDPPTDVSILHHSEQVFPKPAGVENLRAPIYNRPDILPGIEVILSDRELGEKTRDLLRLDKPIDRSASLFRLANMLQDDGLSADEAYVVVRATDERWGKFVGRADRERRLEQLIAQAYEHQLIDIIDDCDTVVTEQRKIKLGLTGWGSLGRGLPERKFLIDGALSESGFMMLAGASGVGKSQLAIGLCARLILNAGNWAGYKLDTQGKQQRIIYHSLEMDELDVRYTVDRLSEPLSTGQLDLLEQNLLFNATLEPFKLDKPKGARLLVEEALKYTPNVTGMVLDTLGAAVSDSTSDESSIRQLFDWLKHIRAKYGIWLIVLAHPRKEENGNKRKELTLDDIRGSQVQQADLDAAFILSEVKGQEGYLKLTNVKKRFGKREPNGIILQRTSNLWLERSTATISESYQAKNDVNIVDDTDEEFNPKGWE